VIGAYDSRGVIIDKRGPTGVFTQEMNPMGNIPLPDSEQKAFEDKFKRYGLRKGQVAVIMGNAALKWQKIGFNVQELGLFEEVKESGIAICNGLSFPPFLLGLSDTTYNNQKEASKGLYQETIIPESESIYEQINNAFHTHDYGIIITKDYSHVAALQEDRLNNAKVRKELSGSAEKEFKNNLVTLNEWRLLLDYDPLTNGFGDMYYYELIDLNWQFGNTGLQGGDTMPTTAPDVGTPKN
jgi:phage portal protein BeeE